MIARRALVFVLASFLLATSVSAETVRRYQREVAVASDGVLELDLQTGGTVEVRGWSRDIVVVKAEVTGEDPDAAVVVIDETGSGIRVRVTPRTSDRRASYSLAVQVMAPQGFGVDVGSRGGDVEIEGLSGPVRGEAVGGDILLEQVTGEVDVQTLGGDIHLDSASGPIRARVRGGDVTAALAADEDASAPVVLDAAGGDAQLSLSSIASATLDVELTYTKDSAQNFEITSDFPLRLEESDWDTSHDPPRKKVRGSAVLGTGTRPIELRVFNGNLVLVRRDG